MTATSPVAQLISLGKMAALFWSQTGGLHTTALATTDVRAQKLRFRQHETHDASPPSLSEESTNFCSVTAFAPRLHRKESHVPPLFSTAHRAQRSARTRAQTQSYLTASAHHASAGPHSQRIAALGKT